MQNGPVMNGRQPKPGAVICYPLKAVDIECHPHGAEGLSKRAKKL